jgi:DNA-binding NarL/FixJ family response regulator
MASSKVVILSGRSLFAEGTASLLRQKSPDLEITVIDPSDPDTLSRIRDLQPSVVILDSSDESLREICQVDVMLKAVPDLRIIRLDPKQDRMQIVTGEERPAASAADLIKVIGTENTKPQGV